MLGRGESVPANRFPFRASAPDPRIVSRNADFRLLHRPDTSSTPYQTGEIATSLAVRADESLRAIHRRAWYSLLSGSKSRSNSIASVVPPLEERHRDANHERRRDGCRDSEREVRQESSERFRRRIPKRHPALGRHVSRTSRQAVCGPRIVGPHLRVDEQSHHDEREERETGRDRRVSVPTSLVRVVVIWRVVPLLFSVCHAALRELSPESSPRKPVSVRSGTPDPRIVSCNARNYRLLHRPDTSSTPYRTAENGASLAVRAEESLRAIDGRAWYSLLSERLLAQRALSRARALESFDQELRGGHHTERRRPPPQSRCHRDRDPQRG